MGMFKKRSKEVLQNVSYNILGPSKEETDLKNENRRLENQLAINERKAQEERMKLEAEYDNRMKTNAQARAVENAETRKKEKELREKIAGAEKETKKIKHKAQLKNAVYEEMAEQASDYINKNEERMAKERAERVAEITAREAKRQREKIRLNDVFVKTVWNEKKEQYDIRFFTPTRDRYGELDGEAIVFLDNGREEEVAGAKQSMYLIPLKEETRGRKKDASRHFVDDGWSVCGEYEESEMLEKGQLYKIGFGPNYNSKKSPETRFSSLSEILETDYDGRDDLFIFDLGVHGENPRTFDFAGRVVDNGEVNHTINLIKTSIIDGMRKREEYEFGSKKFDGVGYGEMKVSIKDLIDVQSSLEKSVNQACKDAQILTESLTMNYDDSVKVDKNLEIVHKSRDKKSKTDFEREL